MSKFFLSRRLVGATATLLAATGALAQTQLADKPVFASVSVPGNLALTPSVEFPTAVGNAHIDSTYNPASTYLGYFDPDKCYDYRLGTSIGTNPVTVDNFAPVAKAAAHVCNRKWSGNFLNWATTQTIDPFRWALTGGYRVFDTTFATVLEKAYASGQGGTGNFPDRTVNGATTIAGATPLVSANGSTWTSLKIRIQGLGIQMRFSGSGDNNSGNPTGFVPTAGNWAMGTSYVVAVRARVCDKTLGTDYLEANCMAYGSNYKPEGLIQQYANQIRFSAFGYLNDGNLSRDGAVLRARQKFVGPTQPVPGGSEIANARAEWDASTGIMITNPDATDATAAAAYFNTPISNSGVMNYLNKFGSSGSYKTYDPVGELYYAALRYFRNLGNVSSWSTPGSANASTRATYADGFPVIDNWDDPILYSCQKNFILGIGDVNTHADRNLPGSTGTSEPSKPAEVSADTAVNATTYTNYVGVMNGQGNIAGTSPYNSCCTNNGALMAGLAYWANSNDIRPDVDVKSQGKQTVQTYWVDVLELQTYKNNNQYYLATKYGGAQLPSDFNPATRTTDLTQSWWHSGPSSDTVGGQLRPDTYFTAGQPAAMVSGLSKAFASIASRMKAYSTSLALADPVISSTGTANYAAQFDASSWTGEVVARSLSVDPNSNGASSSDIWRFTDKLAAQAAGSGWDNARYMVTWNTSTRTAVPFRLGNLASAQSTALDTSYRTGNDAQDYLNYIRGDRSQEQNSVVSGSSKAYRTRVALVGDIVNAKLTVVGPPNFPLSEASNPGYGAYMTAKANRPNVLVVPTNYGVVHVIDGSLTSTTAGKELFAYVPGGVYTGPNSSPAVDGMQWVGNPDFEHRYLVDAPASTMDVDFGKTVGGSGTDWRSIVVGGMGKGGRSIYALDLTDVGSISSESAATGKVLWEFTDSDMGYTYGEPLIVKLAQYGWVVIVPAGHNNPSGKNHLYILNARTGALLQRVDTPTGTAITADDGTPTSPSGMSTISAFFPDTSTVVAESVYAGDLRGAVWRFDLSAATGSYPLAVKVARATDAAGTVEPITTRILAIIQSGSNRRFLAFGTGKMLASSDLNSTQVQRMYAIVDGSAGKFASETDLPGGTAFPISTANLVQLTDVTQPVVIDFNVKSGWYLNAQTGYRIITDPAYFGSTVAFAATLPNNSDPCKPSGSSIVYALDLGTGKTQFTNNAAYLSPGFSVTDLRFVKVGNQVILAIGGDNDNPPPPTTPPCYGTGSFQGACVNPPGSVGNKILNWREVPLRNSVGGTL